MNTTYFLNLMANNLYKNSNTPAALPSVYYVGLSTTTPTMAGGSVSEPSTSAGYARVQLPGASLGNAVDGVITNTAAISWPESTSAWGTVTYFVIYDSATVGEGNLLIYGALPSPRVIEAETVLTIRPGNITLMAQNPS